MAVSPRDSAAVLAQAAVTVGPLIRSRVSGLPPEIRHVAGLHFGWWNDDGAALETAPAHKSVRPALTLLACQAVGGRAEAAAPAAVAVELVHNASLLHDDIIDHAPQRRGRPALWAAKGLPAAILAGDALFFTAVQTLADLPEASRTVPVLLACVQALIEGEYLDTLLEATADATEHQVLAVAAGKTGELLACACELGAAAHNAGPERAGHLRAFGHHLGIAFQRMDDVLGIWGDQAVTGKPALSDLRARKMTLPVATAMTGDTPSARELRALYRAQEPLTGEECLRAAELIEKTSAREATLERARQYTADALKHLDLAQPEPQAGAELTALAELLTARDR
ncbi:polyprenyl synthetase family protein [Streptomyces sp. NPDC086554]|uniref:polyprenyl synthetase family protein n=1 Tax=Streptomyces sp. NPDC086554 TaxID=3154864 RepID=UPI00343AF849